MKMGGRQSEGFTIVETLIVLAISGILAASTLLLVSGKQNKTEFMVAANGLKQQMEQIINETRNGYYPGKGGFSCTSGSPPIITKVAPPAPPAPPVDQGTNGGCIFLGKAIEFGIPANLGDDGAEQTFATYPLAGNRQVNIAGTNQEVLTYGQAKPVVLAPSTSTPPNYPDLSTFFRTQNGLSFKKAVYHLDSGANLTDDNYAVLAFADNLSGYSYTAGDLNSATQKLNLYYFKTSWASLATVSSGGAVKDMNSILANPAGTIDVIPGLDSVDLCFDSGTTKQSVTLKITGKGQLSVTINVSSSLCS